MPKPKKKSRKGVAGRPKSAKSSDNSDTDEEERRKYIRESVAKSRCQVLIEELTSSLDSKFFHRSHPHWHGTNGIPRELWAHL